MSKDAIADNIANAAPATRSPKDDPPPTGGKGLPDDCPFMPLGMKDDWFYYMDANRQLRALKSKDHSRLNIMALAARRIADLQVHWPKFDKDGAVKGFDADAASASMMDACGEIGPVDIEKRVRGPGAWLGDDGQLVMHCGDLIYKGDAAFKPGKIGDHVYPSAPALPHPSESDDAVAGEEILDMLKSWNWRRPDVDPHLLLGWIGAGLMGAALDWRPLVWVTGDKATGKSTLHKLVSMVIDDRAMVSSVDASAAGIRQAVGHMSLPVTLDELEADEDNRKANDIVKLARYACSGGQALRGGADHKGAAFTLRNCFMFSSILIPPMLSQDVSRMAILQLDKVTDALPPALEPDRLKQFGRAFRRRLLRKWPEFARHLELYRMQLAAAGHSGRSADQFGTLLACHDLLIYDREPTADVLESWGKRLEYSMLSEAEDDKADWERCLEHLMTSQVDVFRGGERKSVGELVLQAAGKIAGADPIEANKHLGRYGLRVREHAYATQVHKVLMVANAHQGLGHLFKDTHWGAKSGTSGVWVQSLRRVPNSQSGDNGARFDGILTRFTMFPITNLIDVEKTGGHYAHAS